MKKLLILFFLSLGCSWWASAQVFETGFVGFESASQTAWYRVSFKEIYSNPVVITGPTADHKHNQAAGNVRVRNVTPTGFEYQTTKTGNANRSGSIRDITFSYLVIESGTHTISGQTWRAGTVAGNTDGSYQTVPFATGDFSSPPVVFTQLASDQDPFPAILRVNNVSADGFALKVDEMESYNGLRTAVDNIYYLAVQVGNGAVGSGANSQPYETGVVSVDDQLAPFNFSGSFDEPLLFAEAQTVNEDDPLKLSYHQLHRQGAELQLREGKSDDLETNHGSENVGYLVLQSEQALGRRLIWYERFELPRYLTVDTGPSAWAITSAQNNTETTNGNRGIESFNDEATWRSEVIPIAGYANVQVEIDIEFSGDHEDDDFTQLFYKLDGGPEIPLTNGLWHGSEAIPMTATIGGIQGDQLEIVARFNSDANDKKFLMREISVFTESNERHAIKNGGWDDGRTWSYTPDGPSCQCIPNPLSNTYIDGHLITLGDYKGNTHNLTVYSGGKLSFTNTISTLTLFNDAALTVASGGKIEHSIGGNVRFAQWNLLDPDNTTIPIGKAYPGVEVVIEVNEPNGLQAYDMDLNALGKYTIQGTGGIDLSNNLDVNLATEVTNNLVEKINIANNLELSNDGLGFTNWGQIVVGNEWWYQQNNQNFVNEGTLMTESLTVANGSKTGNQLTNRGSVTVNGVANLGGNGEFVVDNYGTLDFSGSLQGVATGSSVEVHNHTDATLLFGGFVDKDFHLFTHYENNVVHYNGVADQRIATPRDINDPAQQGPYWHLTFSNKNTGTASPSESAKYFAASVTDMDINGDVTIIGTAAGRATFSVYTDKNLSVAGHWRQQESDASYAHFAPGPETGSETVSFDGTIDQYVYNNEIFSNLIINKETGNVYLPNGVRTKDQVDFVRGIVNVEDSKFFTFQANSTVSTASDDSHVRGQVRKVGANDFVFPVGDGTYYRPISVQGLTDPTNITVMYANSSPPNTIDKPDEMINFGVCGYWEMNSSRASTSGKITMYWDANCPVDLDRVAIARWNGTQWEEVPGTAVGNSTDGKITTNAAISELGLFTLTEIVDNPVAYDDPVITEEDVSMPIEVLFNDEGENLNPVSILIVQPPQHGTVSVNPTTGIITYMPEADYNNEATISDVFTYTVKDIKGTESNEATVSITVTPVNDAPRVTDDYDTTNFAIVLEATSVLADDTDIEGDNFTASLASNPSNGTLDFRPDGTYTYTPNATFNGDDSFTYQACDDGSPSACATATVSIFVRPFNYAPRAQADAFGVEEDRTLEGNVTVNDTDINPDDILTVDTNPVQSPQHGTVALQADGNFIYAPEANFFGADSLAYQVCDNGGPVLCDTAWVYIQVTPVNDAPVAVADDYVANEGEKINGQVLANDYDIEGSELINVELISSPMSGKLILQADGSFTYIPHSGFVGEDEFIYRVCEAEDPTLCGEAVVRLRIEVGALAIPKGFSPNGDQVGDYWQIKGITGYPGSIVTIFNRWGNMVFQVMGYDNQQVLWKGEANRGVRVGGNRLPDGTYFYVIDLSNGQKPLSGYVLLKR